MCVQLQEMDNHSYFKHQQFPNVKNKLQNFNFKPALNARAHQVGGAS